jgi:hypothetical protein
MEADTGSVFSATSVASGWSCIGVMRAANRLTVTMSVSLRATLAYGSGQGNVGLREKSRTITFGHYGEVYIMAVMHRSQL